MKINCLRKTREPKLCRLKRLIKVVFLLSLLLLSKSFSLYISSATQAVTDGILPTVALSAQSAVLIEPSSGKIIYGKNQNKKLPMASTTKIMTALVALECGNLDKTVIISKDAVGIEGSSIYLTEGERLSMLELLYALLLESANDAAAAIAIDIAGSISDFAVLMNKKAAELGLTSTHFLNPHGLYDENHFTTAHELALITAEALKYDEFRQIVSTERKTIPKKDGEKRFLFNHNKLLRICRDAIGVKTGFTKKSGRCLVSAALRDGVEIVAVTLNAPSDWNDHIALMDYAFDRLVHIKLANKAEFSQYLPVVGGELSLIEAVNLYDLSATVERENQNFTHKIELSRFYYAPIKKGDTLGEISYYNNGEKVTSSPLVAAFDIPACEKQDNFWRKILIFLRVAKAE